MQKYMDLCQLKLNRGEAFWTTVLLTPQEILTKDTRIIKEKLMSTYVNLKEFR